MSINTELNESFFNTQCSVKGFVMPGGTRWRPKIEPRLTRNLFAPPQIPEFQQQLWLNTNISLCSENGNLVILHKPSPYKLL